jgi:hypothetical protein
LCAALFTAFGGQVPHEAFLAIAGVAGVVWTAGFIVRGLPYSRGTTGPLITAMQRLQFAYLASVIALVASDSGLRLIGSVFFAFYVGLLAEAWWVRRGNKIVLLKFYVNHIHMLEQTGERDWLWLCVWYDVLPTYLIFAFPYPGVVAWVSIALLFSGYQNLLSGLYEDLNKPLAAKPRTAADSIDETDSETVVVSAQ